MNKNDFLQAQLSSVDELLKQAIEVNDPVGKLQLTSRRNEILKEQDIGGTLYTQRYTPNDDQIGGMDFPQFTDFPFIEDPNAFVTHRALENWLREQNPNEDPAIGEPPTGDTPDNALANPGQFGPGEAGMGAGGLGGMPGEVAPLTSSQIGRVYELKKIYSRLTAIESFLSRTVDQSMLSLRKYVSQAIDLFEIVISNIQQYQDKIDDIIVTYYKLLDIVYTTIRKYFSEER